MRLLTLFSAILLCLIGCDADTVSAGPFTRLTGVDQSIITKHLGNGWAVDTRIIIPDVNDVSGLSKQAAIVANMIGPTMQALKVKSVYDCSASPSAPKKLDNLSVKVLVFETPQAAAEFAAAKYGSGKNGFEKLEEQANTATYRGIKHGKIVKIKDHLHVSVMQLNDSSANAALAADFLAALPAGTF